MPDSGQTMSSGGHETIPDFTKKKYNCRFKRFRVLGSLWKHARSIQDLFLPTPCAANYLPTPSELGYRSTQSWVCRFYMEIIGNPYWFANGITLVILYKLEGIEGSELWVDLSPSSEGVEKYFAALGVGRKRSWIDLACFQSDPSTLKRRNRQLVFFVVKSGMGSTPPDDMVYATIANVLKKESTQHFPNFEMYDRDRKLLK